MVQSVLTIPVSPDHHLRPLLFYEGTKTIPRDRRREGLPCPPMGTTRSMT